MAIELHITYDGTEPGLSGHRLSLGSFAEPLRLLVAALQRTASGILADADNPTYGSRGGRFAKDAALLDLELAHLAEGSANPQLICTMRPGAVGAQLSLVQDLPELAVVRLVSDIEAESQDKPTNAAARRYLVALPGGVSRQKYTALRDGEVLVEAEFGPVKAQSLAAARPRLLQVCGDVIAVGFEPGATFVSLKSEQRTVRCAATAEQVSDAISLRGARVCAAVLDDETSRLLWIRDAAASRTRSAVVDTITKIHANWSEAMKALAQ